MTLKDEICAKTTQELRAMIPHGAVSSYAREIAIYELQRRCVRPHKKQPGDGKLTLGHLRAQADYIEKTFGISVPTDEGEDDSREVSEQEVNEMYGRAHVAEPGVDQDESPL